QQPQVVVDLGDGADGRTRVVGRRLLFYRNGGGQAVDVVDVRFFHHRQELPRVGRQRLDISALPFSVDRIERERRLAGTRQAGEHDQFVAGQTQIHVPEVMSSRAADVDVFHKGSFAVLAGQP